MKITFVNSFFPPWRGGAETYVDNLSRCLQKRGHRVKVICGNPPAKVGREVLDGVEVERLRVTGRIFGTPIIMGLFLKLMTTDTDIIHANFPSPYNAYFASVASRVREIPAILTWHNDLPDVTRIARALIAVHDNVVLPSYLSTFKSIIATSELYVKTSPLLRARRECVATIPNGVDTKRFIPSIRSDDLRSSVGAGDSRIVLFVGALTRWHGYKGLDVAIKALVLLKDHPLNPKLVVVGDGELRNGYAQLAAHLGIGDQIIFAGNVPSATLPKYYALSEVLVLPSKDRSEGFGLAILEANAAGRPAIGTTVGGIPSVIHHRHNGLLVPPNSPEALAEAIRTVLENEDLNRQMRRNARAFAEQHDWSRVAEETEKIYRHALS